MVAGTMSVPGKNQHCYGCCDAHSTSEMGRIRPLADRRRIVPPTVDIRLVITVKPLPLSKKVFEFCGNARVATAGELQRLKPLTPWNVLNVRASAKWVFNFAYKAGALLCLASSSFLTAYRLPTLQPKGQGANRPGSKPKAFNRVSVARGWGIQALELARLFGGSRAGARKPDLHFDLRSGIAIISPPRPAFVGGKGSPCEKQKGSLCEEES
jgi:hypothetical protein